MTIPESPHLAGSESLRHFRRQLLQLITGIALYVGFVFAKVAVYMNDSSGSSPAHWNALAVMTLCEASGWTLWTIKRYTKSLGPAIAIIPLICSIYALTSVSLLAFDIEIYPFPEFAVRQGMFLQSMMATNLWAFTAIFISRRTSDSFGSALYKWRDNLRVSHLGLLLFACVGCVLAGIYVYNFYASGAAAMLGSRGGDRAEILTTLETGKSWLVTVAFMAWVMVAAAVSLSRSARAVIRPIHMVLCVLAVIAFFSAYGRLGNRRELSIALLFVCVLLLFTGRRRILALVICGGIVLGAYVGITRSMSPDASTNLSSPTLYIDTFSEAILPNYPLLDRVSAHPDFLWGSSYVRLPVLLIPTFGLWKKPLSLSQQFANDYANGKMGFAYTPVAEGYANFGVLGAVIAPFIWVFAEWTFLRTAMVTHCIPGLVFVSLAFDINRGEFSGILFSVLLYSGLCWLYMNMCQAGGWRTR